MASAAYNQSITTTATKVFNAANDGGKCTTFAINCSPDSAVPVLVNVPGLHEADEWFEVYAGQQVLFRLFNLGIASVSLKTASGTATVGYGVVSKTTVN